MSSFSCASTGHLTAAIHLFGQCYSSVILLPIPSVSFDGRSVMIPNVIVVTVITFDLIIITNVSEITINATDNDHAKRHALETNV